MKSGHYAEALMKLAYCGSPHTQFVGRCCNRFAVPALILEYIGLLQWIIKSSGK